nr:hypothetical protein CFP56_07669 [Quercus suber]
MDRTASADLQGKAETYLYSHLQPLSGDLHATIRELLGLVLDDHDNPLKDLFHASINGGKSLVRTPPRARLQQQQQSHGAPNTASPPKVRKSRLSLRPFRSKESSKPDVSHVAESSRRPAAKAFPPAPDGSGEGYTSIAEEKSSTKSIATQNPPADARSWAAGGNEATQASTDETKYNCIFCEDDYAYKGTCKRHLEQVHVARAYFKCRGCGRRFKTQPEAKKHCVGCGQGFTKVEPEPKKLYSSEFTRQRFATQQQYVDHLLDLCKQPKGQRPERSSHLKLRNLLELPALDAAVRRTSLRLYNDAEAWRNVRWDYDRVTSAVRDLENGILDVPLHPVEDLLCLHRVENFATELFATGRLQSASQPSSNLGNVGSVQQRLMESTFSSQSPDSSTAMYTEDAFPVHQMPPSNTSVNTQGLAIARDLSMLGDAKSKRPLSETSQTMQQRMPAGPSRPDTGVSTDNDHASLDFTMPTQFMTPSSGAFQTSTTWPVTEQPPPYQPAWCDTLDDNGHEQLLTVSAGEQDPMSYLPQQGLMGEMAQLPSSYFLFDHNATGHLCGEDVTIVMVRPVAAHAPSRTSGVGEKGPPRKGRHGLVVVDGGWDLGRLGCACGEMACMQAVREGGMEQEGEVGKTESTREREEIKGRCAATMGGWTLRTPLYR